MLEIADPNLLISGKGISENRSGVKTEKRRK
jgi:hypothetical protein